MKNTKHSGYCRLPMIIVLVAAMMIPGGMARILGSSAEGESETQSTYASEEGSSEGRMAGEESSSAEETVTIPEVQLRFEKGENVSVTLGENGNLFSNPAIPEAEDYNGEIRYNILSDPDHVIADGAADGTISPDGSFRLQHAGTVQIQACAEGTADWLSGESSYTLTVWKQEPVLQFQSAPGAVQAVSQVALFTGETLPEPVAAYEISGAPISGGSIHYPLASQEGSPVEEVDPATGQMSLTGEPGIAYISATLEETQDTEEAEASYMLLVSEWEPEEADTFYVTVTDDAGHKNLANEWYTGNVSVASRPGYLLSTERTLAPEAWQEVLPDVITQDGRDQAVNFYIREKTPEGLGKISSLREIWVSRDTAAPDMTMVPDEPNDHGIYKTDVKVQIEASDGEAGIASGIRSITYRVEADGQETQQGILFDRAADPAESAGAVRSAEAAGPPAWRGSVTVDAKRNNSSQVVLYVTVTDMAGNVTEKTLPLDIDITPPVLAVSFDDPQPYRTVDGRGYYSVARKALIVITERSGHFDAAEASAGIQIRAVDARGKAVPQKTIVQWGSWQTLKGAIPDQDTHAIELIFAGDANYTLEAVYTDRAGNSGRLTASPGTETPYAFTVDTTVPMGSVTAGKLGTWEKLARKLTYGRWSRKTVKVTGNAWDATSPVADISYYKTSDTKALTEQQLRAIADWKPFDTLRVKKSERFTVYLRIEDMAGNVTFLSTNGLIVDKKKPKVEKVSPEIRISSSEEIFSGDAVIAVSVKDPAVRGVSAGLRNVRYEVKSLGKTTQSGDLYTFTKKNPRWKALRRTWSSRQAFTVRAARNNSNDVQVTVFAEDNAGNRAEKTIRLRIDTTEPSVSVQFDNNSGHSYGNDTCYREPRTATIAIAERNFDPNLVQVQIVNQNGGHVPNLSDWSVHEGSGNGDDTTYTASVTFREDGDYSFDIHAEDLAGNRNAEVSFGDSQSPQHFIIDRTAPEVTVTYEGGSPPKGDGSAGYYAAARTARIMIREQYFEEDRVEVSITAVDEGTKIEPPVIGPWKDSGEVHTAEITFAADARYMFDIDYTDPAGNPAADYPGDDFVIDCTPPEVKVTGITDRSANRSEGDIGFEIAVTDTNYDRFDVRLAAVLREGDHFVTKDLTIGAMKEISHGAKYVVTNLAQDGIYRVFCTASDRAGNTAAGTGTQEPFVTFSVNRNGSVFELGAETAEIVKQYYVQQVTEDLQITEVNADELKSYEVTLNGKSLKEGTDFTVAAATPEGGWKQYVYTLPGRLFAGEGAYTVVVSSTDRAENDAYSDIKDAAVRFVVDRTAPRVSISGMEEHGRYQTDQQRVTLIPADDGGELSSLQVFRVNAREKTEEMLLDLSGEALLQALEENDGEVSFNLPQGLYQDIRIRCEDSAADSEGQPNCLELTVQDVSVSESRWKILWANRPLRFGIFGGMVGAAALAAGVIIKKKRKRAA